MPREQSEAAGPPSTLEPPPASDRTEPPGPRGLPFVGVGLSFLRDTFGFLTGIRDQFGAGVVRLPMGSVQAYLVSEPELIEQVLVTKSRDYRKPVNLRSVGDELLGQGLVTSDGDHWLRQRRLIQPGFHKERIAAWGSLMVTTAERFCERLRPRERRDLHDDMQALTLEVMSQVLFSEELSAETQEIRRALDVVTARYADPLLNAVPFFRKLPLRRNRRFLSVRARLDEIIQRLICRHREEPREDLLGMLLGAQTEDGGRMSERQLRDEVMTLLLAGHETTALALVYTLYLLGKNPEAERRLHEELDEVLGPHGRAPTVSDVPRLRFLESALLESLRIYPPVYAVGREALCDVEIGDYRIPRGALVLMSQWAVHRDPRFFPEPEQFRPERWMDGLQHRLPRYAYFPFGGGPRLCIGRDLALLESMLVLATLSSRYRFRIEDHPLRLLPSITVRPRDPLWVWVEARGGQRPKQRATRFADPDQP